MISLRYLRYIRPFEILPNSSAKRIHHSYLAQARLEMKRYITTQGKNEPGSKMSKELPYDHTFGFGQRKPIDEDGFKDFLVDIKETKASYAGSIEECEVNMKRVRLVNGIEPRDGIKGIVYWTTRDQRVDDNWGLLLAQKNALKYKCPLYYVFCLVPRFQDATIRQFDFLLKGQKQNEKQCQALQIDYHCLLGFAKDVLPGFVEENDIGMVITDFWPLREPLRWLSDVGKRLAKLKVPLYQCDSHNIVPVWVASDKREFGAYTIRRKIQSHLDEFLTEIPPVIKHPHKVKNKSEPMDWEAAYDSLDCNHDVPPVTWAVPGTINGYRMLYEFITQRLKNYDEHRNDPCKHGLSCLSPYFHFGQLSVQRAILCVSAKSVKSKAQKSVDAFVEEALIRRELADNYCFYEPEYDNLNGAWEWARKTLDDHRKDTREHIYTLDQFEKAQTHEKIWNAAQIQMVREGKMHGYFRMYWAKKILEWSETPEQALEIAIYLNDKYELDGRDPNGYVGCMWSIGGVHDRGWTERPIFGKIRWMSETGCLRKFDCKTYIAHYSSL